MDGKQGFLDQIIHRLVAGFAPERIILFGSRARGDNDDRSDIDLLVVGPLTGSRRARLVAMDRCLRGLKAPTDILLLTPEEFERDRHIPGTIARPAWLEGRVLYERPGAEY